MFRFTHVTFEDLYYCIARNGVRYTPEDPRLPQAAWENRHGGYHLDWANGRDSIGRWDYQDVPQPTNEALCAVEQPYLDYEIDQPHTNDIYKADIRNAPAGFDWVPFKLAEVRRCDTTKLSANDTIHFSRGYWEIKMQGYVTNELILQIARVVPEGNLIIYQQNCQTGRFADRHFFFTETSTEIRVRAQRVNRDSLLDPDFFIIVARV